jgi:hypothetical protein
MTVSVLLTLLVLGVFRWIEMPRAHAGVLLFRREVHARRNLSEQAMRALLRSSASASRTSATGSMPALARIASCGTT